MKSPFAPSSSAPSPLPREMVIKVVGVGDAGSHVVDGLYAESPHGMEFLTVNTDLPALERSVQPCRLQAGKEVTRGLSAGGDPLQGRVAAEQVEEGFRKYCENAHLVFIVAGLGGGTGTGAAPVLARCAKESGALVLGVVALPFEFEGARRGRQASAGLHQLRAVADGVICFRNQKILHSIKENTSLAQTLRLANRLVGEALCSLTSLLIEPGLIHLDFAALAAALHGRHSESAFACVEAGGPGRAEIILDRLFHSPMFDEDHCLAKAETIIVSFAAGSDLSMEEVRRIMDELGRRGSDAHMIMGASVESDRGDSLRVVVIASHHGLPLPEEDQPEDEFTDHPSGYSVAEEAAGLEDSFLHSRPSPRPPSRFVPPPPELSPEEKEQIFQERRHPKRRYAKGSGRLRQGLLPLEIVSKGRFEKSEPTIHRGEDLDVPTYIRRGIVLN